MINSQELAIYLTHPAKKYTVYKCQKEKKKKEVSCFTYMQQTYSITLISFRFYKRLMFEILWIVKQAFFSKALVHISQSSTQEPIKAAGDDDDDDDEILKKQLQRSNDEQVKLHKLSIHTLYNLFHLRSYYFSLKKPFQSWIKRVYCTGFWTFKNLKPFQIHFLSPPIQDSIPSIQIHPSIPQTMSQRSDERWLKRVKRERTMQ